MLRGRKNIVKSMIVIGGVKVANGILQVGFMIYLTQWLGTVQFGIYTTATVIATSISLVTSFGPPKLVLRETASNLAEQNYPAIKRSWAWAERFVFIFSTVAIMLGAGIMTVSLGFENLANFFSYLLALLIIPIYGLGGIRALALRGLGFPAAAEVPELIIRPLLMLTVCFLLSFVVKGSALTVVIVHLIAAIAAWLVGHFILHRFCPPDLQASRPDQSPTPSEWIKTSVSFAAITSANQANRYADILVVSYFMRASDVGAYRVGQQLSTLATLGTYAILTIFGRRFAMLATSSTPLRMNKFLWRLCLLSVAATIALAVPLVWLVDYLILNVFGSEFQGAKVVFQILIISHIANSVLNIIRQKMEMTGREAIAARLTIGASIGNALLNISLVPFFGMQGAAFATLSTSVAMLLVLITLEVRLPIVDRRSDQMASVPTNNKRLL